MALQHKITLMYVWIWGDKSVSIGLSVGISAPLCSMWTVKEVVHVCGKGIWIHRWAVLSIQLCHEPKSTLKNKVY